MKRSTFIKSSALAGFGALILPNSLFSYPNRQNHTKKVRLGFIAMGMRGQTLLQEMIGRDDVEIIAIADPDPGMMQRGQKMLKEHQRRMNLLSAANAFDIDEYNARVEESNRLHTDFHRPQTWSH